MSQDSCKSQNGTVLPQFRSKALIAVGANMPSVEGDARETVIWAIREFANNGWVIRSVSHLFETPCFPPGAGPDYINAAFVLDTELSAPEVLAQLHAVEAAAGRERLQRWGQRSLDLDLIALGDQVLPDAQTVSDWMALPLDQQVRRTPDELLLPHPRLQDRAFVLGPLVEVAPDWVHPLTGKTVREMFDMLPQAERDAVKRLVYPVDWT
ncbi:2-amino-4-hydroxy-6-hydroxymethyldihydropteridine diphosphokinase [Aliishimia ponticola]|uniref:2-amino-4-hydroxy-6-hydroxymethyldihydropteridine pyrophosphokinase n=1 Tax=Aliishimia ponticola TaxID=2499833 RepID=A0A4S4NAJ4_9RHOB|nr:2-amino-4-hydroxy-6-hydroxymethyldihydropteridine diphosphokinase [Aliishimia ponticola]THH35058.1 2-amino-4-hydroxy-6-hydroxymethyldihydropteridine diphosphokinase [Aliishimia ponticola]